MSQAPSGAGSEREFGFYEIRLRGHLGLRWANRLEVSSLSHESDGTTALRATLVDQAALHGLLNKIRDLGLPLISVVPLTEATRPTNPSVLTSHETHSRKGNPT
ncbi:MAG: hypothetical protein ABR972_13515 [Acidimicrobiales bacterium]|jgi:hypothetical protein